MRKKLAGKETHCSIHHKQPRTNYEEVESSYNHSFEYVAEHRVKAESAPLLRAIFKKYGDITSGNYREISSIRAELLVMKQEVAAIDIKAGVITLDEEKKLAVRLDLL
ncbi:hypothetical protein SASPL_113443 [Salvia splendens]|uniref:Uncharacterized protein n=1 Tax=Salvia splendens TaxID=180675 RepID=A0A8X9A127_SALSN|nr:hypothetical protein SASPL_113443 [Salvia splendens]